MSETMIFKHKIPGKILVHVAFYYAAGKLKYLKQLLGNFNAYGFSEIDIVIDTDSTGGRKVSSSVVCI